MTQTTAASPQQSQAPAIAIIGLEGSGKTVLATTLAKRLSAIDERGIFLNPQGTRTFKYVEKVWHTLQSGEWPPSTPPGELFELRWRLHVGQLECDVRLADAPGQDLRAIFGDDQIYQMDSLPQRLQPLAQYCRSADIVLFLIDLEDFLGTGDAMQRTENEAAIKSAMDFLRTDIRLRRVCMVLTKGAQYRETARQHGGWRALLSEQMPLIFGAHIALGNMAVYVVDAVADVGVGVDEYGLPQRFPKPGFRSQGLDALVQWLVKSVEDFAPLSVPLSGLDWTTAGSAYAMSLGPIEGPTAESVQECIIHWGDGQTATIPAAGADGDRPLRHTYRSAGQHTITVDVAQDGGVRRSAVASKLIEVKAAPATPPFKMLGCAAFVLLVLGVSIGTWLRKPEPGPEPERPVEPLAPIVLSMQGAHLEGTGLFETYGMSTWTTVTNTGRPAFITITCTVSQDVNSWSQKQTIFLGLGASQQVTFWITGPKQDGAPPTYSFSCSQQPLWKMPTKDAR